MCHRERCSWAREECSDCASERGEKTVEFLARALSRSQVIALSRDYGEHGEIKEWDASDGVMIENQFNHFFIFWGEYFKNA